MDEEIRLYIETLKSLNNSIEELESPSGYDNRNHKITLMFSLLDLMSKCVTNESSNRKRFIHLIHRFSNWENGERVSLPQLSLYLAQDNSSRLINLRQYVNEAIANWPTDRPISIETDPGIGVISTLWPLDYKGPKKTTIEHFTHCNLLWNQRNRLVHEMRKHGYGWDLFEENEPYYTTCNHTARNSITGELEIERRTFELYYPYSFYNNIVNEVIQNINMYLEQNDINPYESYKFGSLWLDIED